MSVMTMRELERRVASGKALGNRVELITPANAKARFPLLEQDMTQGALWDPDAGLVKSRSQMVAGELVDAAVASGKLLSFANTACAGLRIENGRIQGVETTKGFIADDHVVVCAGLWGRLIASMAGEDLPIMPVDHPLTFFKPYLKFAGTGKDIGYPLLRDQGNSAYLRDTGDPKTPEGGQIEWGCYEEENPRMCHLRDLLEKEQARLSPSQRDLELEQIMAPLERAIELTPVLAELSYDEKLNWSPKIGLSSCEFPIPGTTPQPACIVPRSARLEFVARRAGLPAGYQSSPPCSGTQFAWYGNPSKPQCPARVE